MALIEKTKVELGKAHPLDKYLRIERIPTLWCPGCGLGVSLAALLKAIDRRVKEGVLDPKKIVFVTGIGCTARTSFYVGFDAAHTLHGRAVAFATGAKLANPKLELIVLGGDGDIAGIGGNHLIHAARRNMDLLVIMNTNFIYAMTGGQLAPTTPPGLYTTTTPQGSREKPMNVIKLLAAFEVNYVARGSSIYPQLLEQYYYKALGMRGFRFIEVVSTCPEVFGRHIGYRDPVTLYDELKKRVKVKTKPSIEESSLDWDRGIIIGEYIVNDYPGYIELIMGGKK
ncbi:MAG: 2-oxoglutarate synthase [Desulfurococcales archaeon ex4484_58]|nr:MAG: 2-oxoglutarate synthase [Desulfurococcales archaeon ex4484_58]